MNVYDFDHTIYDGDSTLDFWKFCIRKYPKCFLSFPKACCYALLFRAKICSREKFKAVFYSFLGQIPDVQHEVTLFWNANMDKIKSFYLRQQRPDDVIISASPDFLISEICNRMKICCIASEVDPRSGTLLGPNCRGEEKVRRFYQQFPNTRIHRFYSDSESDRFLAQQAETAFLVKKDTVGAWTIT